MDSSGDASYRPAKHLPFELAQHIGIFFEEKLYTQALNLLLNIISSGGVADTSTYIPSPQHLALAATCLVHPCTTTRANNAEEEEAPNASLQLLRLTRTLVGPVNAKFNLAFSFTHFQSSRRGGRRRPSDETPPDDDMRPLNLDLSKSASLWSRAEDFWHAVGWAFNCSVLHRERWERWQTWLEFMCGVLEDDWALRIKLYQEGANDESKGDIKTRRKKPNEPQILKESLIFRFVSEGVAGYGAYRRILRAIFADGGSSSVNEFREVFHHELKQRRQDKQNIKKREVEVNIDKDEFGDYLTDDDDDDDEENPENSKRNSSNDRIKTKPGPTRQTKRPRRGTRSSKDPNTDDADPALPTAHSTNDISHLGGYQALALRQRLLHLLSNVADHLQTSFISLEDLYHLFVENIRHLPLPIFQAFVSPSVLPHFSAAAQTSLCEFLLFRMRESAAPMTDEMYLNQDKLEQCFLPYAASTTSISDNAKVSMALEALLMLLADSEMLKITPQLRDAVQLGIETRADKVQTETKKSQANRRLEDLEWGWLVESGERLMFLVDELLNQG
ncbi:hypothetical protein FE257_002933 [Aspergillus nanangensis]|uniref:Uncharacterized protein n=1 Tax=Aspergillus nanangensis TaxID=2582783 RepID=A0AAD4CSL7_ASPNN|nr:hypothetical protein FE257_002933 [Aspergillus nanangensis]